MWVARPTRGKKLKENSEPICKILSKRIFAVQEQCGGGRQ